MTSLVSLLRAWSVQVWRSETNASAPEPLPAPTRACVLTDHVLQSQNEKICSIYNLAMELRE